MKALLSNTEVEFSGIGMKKISKEWIKIAIKTRRIIEVSL